MPSRFDLPHIDISALAGSQRYMGSGSAGSGAIRIREEHGRRLQEELNAAFAAADEDRPVDDRLPPVQGTYLEVELYRGTKPDVLERKRDGIRPGAVKASDQNERTVALYVPDNARTALQQILADYTSGPLTERENPPNRATIGPIESFRRARLQTFWTDAPEMLPTNPQDTIWWAVWCRPDAERRIEDVCARLDIRAAGRDRRLFFPEATVIPVLAPRSAVELMLFMTGDIDELRRASDSPAFFTDDVRGDQSDWANDFAERITWPGLDAPAVCLFDTGVNRGHPLIEPALAPNDLQSIYAEWGSDDHDEGGHGTAMAGIALHGDLTPRLADQSEPLMGHRVESVKVLPPTAFDPNDPHSYGVVAQSAVSLSEIASPERRRGFCMAVTNRGVSGDIASTWSAAIDQAAVGQMVGDDDDSPKRLFVISTGNVPPEIDVARVQPQESFPAEDPSQAWNALTVGGYTELIDISDAGYDGWSPLVEAGDTSPHGRFSVRWPQGRAPFKPEVVLEAGNRALSPAGTEILTVDSLCVLSTGRDVDRLPLVPFQATSAATAEAARMAVRLAAAHPDYWPETIRALIVHSAQWTEPMLRAFEYSAGKRDNYALVRKYGYGVPDFERANASALNHLALVAQTEIQPFRHDGRKFNECHYYRLPLPNDVLEQLDNQLVELKITLSYFVEPNPGFSANVDPQRYQSHGLRFDLRRKGETAQTFRERVNAAERDDPRVGAGSSSDDSRWVIGPQGVSSGSLHCDVWKGPAVDLLGRDMLCVKPVNGWWRQRSSIDVCNKRTRYALIVTMSTPDIDVDLYTPVLASLEIPAEIDTSI